MTRFDDFWAICPRKRGKGAARRAYVKACQTVDEETILEGARRWRQESIGKDPTYICHPATWLNQERWDDEPDQVVKPDEDAVWRDRAAVIRIMGRSHGRCRQDVEECHRRGLLTDQELEAAL